MHHHLLHLLLPFFLFFFFFFFFSFANGISSPEYIHFDLIHHQNHPNHHRSSNLISAVNLALNDYNRQQAIRRHLGREQKNNVPSLAFRMPMSSGAFAGTGQYFAQFQVGTPAQKFLLVVDTGSDLTWIKCKNGTAGNGGSRLFDAGESRTFRPITCSSALCKLSLPFSLAKCPNPTSPCLFDYIYDDGSRSQGRFARESATITLSSGHREKLPGIIVGCSSSSAGTAFTTSDGVLGLGYSNTSFTSVATSHFGGKFSYCLVDHLSPRNVSSYLVFGHQRTAILHYVDLVIRPTLTPFYSVKIAGISIGKQLLNIPNYVWDPNSGGGVILDSGTSLTVLVSPAYKAVTSVLTKALVKIPRIPDVDPFEFCYNWTVGMKPVVPSVVVHIGKYGGRGLERLVPPVKSYLIDVADGVKCLGFLPAQWPGTSTIGNILQQNHLWEFDVRNRRLGFKRSNCER